MNNYWLKSGVLTLMQRTATVLFGFGTFYVLVRMLDKSEFGTWSLFITVTTLLETVRNGLVQNSMVKFLANAQQEDRPRIISASFAISGALTIACIVLNISFAPYMSRLWNSPELIQLFQLYSIVYVISWILTQIQFIDQAQLRFKTLLISTVIRQGLLFAFAMAAWLVHHQVTLAELVYVQIIGVSLATVVGYLNLRKHFVFPSSIDMSWIRQLFHFGKYGFGTSVSSVIFNSINQAMLGGMISTAATAAYNIAVRITNLVEIPTSSVAAIVFPQSARRIETEGQNAVKVLYEKSVAAILAILAPGLLLIAFFSEFVVDFVAGEQYAESVPILKVTLFNCILIPFGRQFGTMLDSIGKPHITFKNVLLSATINIVLNFIFIRQFGIMGAAYATLLASLIGFVISQLILRRELHVSLIATLKYTLEFYTTFYSKYVARQQQKT